MNTIVKALKNLVARLVAKVKGFFSSKQAQVEAKVAETEKNIADKIDKTGT